MSNEKHQKWETTVLLIFTSPHWSFFLLLLLIPWVIQHLMLGDIMCYFVPSSCNVFTQALWSQQSPGQNGSASFPGCWSTRKKGLFKVLAPSPGWLCSNLKQDFSPSKISVCSLPVLTWNKREEHSTDKTLLKKIIRKLEANLTKNIVLWSKIIIFFTIWKCFPPAKTSWMPQTCEKGFVVWVFFNYFVCFSELSVPSDLQALDFCSVNVLLKAVCHP